MRKDIKEALEFYCNPDSYINWGYEKEGRLMTPIEQDHGVKAYECLHRKSKK